MQYIQYFNYKLKSKIMYINNFMFKKVRLNKLVKLPASIVLKKPRK